MVFDFYHLLVCAPCLTQTSSLSEKAVTCYWCVVLKLPTGRWRSLGSGNVSHLLTMCDTAPILKRTAKFSYRTPLPVSCSVSCERIRCCFGVGGRCPRLTVMLGLNAGSVCGPAGDN